LRVIRRRASRRGMPAPMVVEIPGVIVSKAERKPLMATSKPAFNTKLRMGRPERVTTRLTMMLTLTLTTAVTSAGARLVTPAAPMALVAVPIVEVMVPKTPEIALLEPPLLTVEVNVPRMGERVDSRVLTMPVILLSCLASTSERASTAAGAGDGAAKAEVATLRMATTG